LKPDSETRFHETRFHETRFHETKGYRAPPGAVRRRSRKDDGAILLVPQSRRYCEKPEWPREQALAIVWAGRKGELRYARADFSGSNGKCASL
jgi:hypothetical protein